MSFVPPLLHYCWFGSGPEPHADFRKGWRLLHPGSTVMRWDETNAPLEHPYLRRVLRERSYSKAADFMRLWLMVNYGGIYLDADVECVRSLDSLRDRPFFVGFQREAGFDPLESVNSAVLGACRGHWGASELLRRLLAGDDGSQAPMESGPRLVSRLLVELGLAYADEEVCLRSPTGESMHVMPRRAFYPYSWVEDADRTRVGPDTFTIHHWDGSWVAAWRASRIQRVKRMSETASQLLEVGDAVVQGPSSLLPQQ